MNGINFRAIINLVIAVLISVIAVNLFIWLLPIILVVILAMYIYGFIKRQTLKRSYKYNNNDKKENSKKKIVIIDEEK